MTVPSGGAGRPQRAPCPAQSAGGGAARPRAQLPRLRSPRPAGRGPATRPPLAGEALGPRSRSVGAGSVIRFLCAPGTRGCGGGGAAPRVGPGQPRALAVRRPSRSGWCRAGSGCGCSAARSCRWFPPCRPAPGSLPLGAGSSLHKPELRPFAVAGGRGGGPCAGGCGREGAEGAGRRPGCLRARWTSSPRLGGMWPGREEGRAGGGGEAGAGVQDLPGAGRCPAVRSGDTAVLGGGAGGKGNRGRAAAGRSGGRGSLRWACAETAAL